MMRCFLPCFGTSKRRNQLPSAPVTTHVGEGVVQPLPRQRTDVEELIDCIAESKVTNEAQSNKSVDVDTKEEEKEKTSREEEAPQTDGHEEDDVINKRSHQEDSSESMFSINFSRKGVSDTAEAEVNSPIQVVKKEKASRKEEAPQTDGHEEDDVISKRSHQEDSSESMFSINFSRKGVSDAAEAEVNSPIQVVCKREAFGSSENTKQPNFVGVKKGPECSAEELNIIKEGEKGKTNHPQYRYKDGSNEKKEGEDVKGTTWVQEESSESLFSLSADSRVRFSSAETENEVNSEMSAQDVLKKKDKENIKMVVQDVNILIPPPPISPEPCLKLSNRRKARQQNGGVDTSLSSWLVESETTPKGKSGSQWSHEDRPILGALTVEEIRMHSLSTASSRRTRSRSPDETPIIGTVGSYWSHTHNTMDLEFNKTGKDVKPKRRSTALQTRLERAFEASVTQL